MIAAAYAVLYVLAAAAGLPLGFALFGRRHAGGWIAGGLIGYAVTALALWVPIRLGMASPLTLMLAWVAASVCVRIVAVWAPEPLVALPAWTAQDMLALAAVLVLTLAIAVPPLARAGARDASGSTFYRAYFTADFVWHEALTAEVARFSSPPRNPYLATRPIHYYWTYFLPPAAGAAALGTGQIETILKVNAVGTALLFVSAIFLCAWTALPRAWPVAAGVTMAIVASSAEGSYALWRFWQRGVPLGEVRNLNIDALANWWPPHGLRIDGLPRCFWWVPQHSMAYALGLLALAIVNAAGSAGSLGTVAVAGVALGGATLMNPFVGAVFSAVWGVAVLLDAARSGEFVKRAARHALAAVPVVLAVGWCVGNQMVAGAGGALQIGWLGEARNAPVRSLLLSLGPALVAALPGLLPPQSGSYRTSAETSVVSAFRRKLASLLLAVVSLGLMIFLRLDVDHAWVGFRAGQMFLVAVPGLIAAGLAAVAPWRRLAGGVAVLAILIGVPTTIIDAYNAQDITNFSQSPNGPWTITITPDETQGLEFLRRVTPPDAVVQMDPLARERSTWSLIPSFAQRRMAAGRPISLLGGTEDSSEYGQRSARVKTLYETASSQDAADIAHALRIDYLWVDRIERAAYPAGVAKFDTDTAHFVPVFANAEVRIYAIR